MALAAAGVTLPHKISRDMTLNRCANHGYCTISIAELIPTVGPEPVHVAAHLIGAKMHIESQNSEQIPIQRARGCDES